MTGSRGDIFEPPVDVVAVLDRDDVGGLVEPQERTAAGGEFATRQPLRLRVRPDRHPLADGERVERRRGEPVTSSGGHDPVVHDLHPRNR